MRRTAGSAAEVYGIITIPMANGDVLFWIEEDGTMATSKWHEQDHTWYYLDASGAAVTGWKEIDGKWYYFKEDHAMATEETIGSYYVGKDGAWDSRK